MNFIKKILILSFVSLTTVLWASDPSDSVRWNAANDSVFVIRPEIPAAESMEEAPDVLDEGLLSSVSANDSIQRYLDLAHTVFGKLRETKNFITSIDEASRFELPVSIPKLVDGVDYELAIHAIRLKPTHAELDVLLRFEIPQNGQQLIFRANGIKFTKKGGIVGDATLQLVGDYAINLSGNKSQIILKGLKSNGNTFVTIDCDGFKELALDADIKFSRDLIRPDNPDGSQGTGNVVTSFSTKIKSWNDFIVQISIPSFQINGVKGMGFNVQDAIFDFSDIRNAPGVQFPEGYESTQMLPDNPNLWRGFYMRELTVRLPPEIKAKGSTRTTFSATNVIIDNMGFSGALKATNIIGLDKGDMNGWAFSVDEIGVTIQSNELREGNFSGKIVIPVADEATPFEYKAVINTGGNYLFSVSPATDMNFNIWQGSKVQIYNASYIDIRVVDGKFLPKAVLHGKMNIQAKLSEKGQGIELADISFEDLQIQSVKPYIKVGAFSFGSEALQQKMAGFPISIQNVGMKNISEREVGLDFNLVLNLTGESGSAFSADAGLTVIGALNTESGRQRWKYQDVAVRSIKVDINGGAFKFKGSLTFYRNDVAYGDGFNGTVNAEFVPNIKVKATAIFGSVQGERYWYADAMASFKPGILVFPGVAFYGFGGGAYYRMKMATNGAGSDLGKTASGVIYVPDMDSGLGIKAILNIGSAPTDQAFNGDITFEVAFFRGGGVRTISLTGNAFIATPKLDDRLGKLTASVGKMANSFKALEERAKATPAGGMAAKIADQESVIKSIHGDIGDAAGSRGAISARAFIQYDFENRELHGNFNVNINLAGGIMKGNGDAVLHFAPHEWYVYIGTPEQRLNLSVGIGPIRVTATSYFMVGSKILGSPPPPPEVSKILGGVDLDYMKDLNTIASGAGFAFGCSFDMDTGDLTFLMFYAHFHAGAGFDIMLKNYGDTYCAGSSKRIGVNGWYANGQLYAFFMGEIGIKVKIFKIRKKIEILSIGAAAVLQAQLPNPFWMRGIVGGRFSVLNGAVKGNCKFEVTLGKKCELVQKKEDDESALHSIAVISELTPANGESEVNVFNTPQAVFNMPVDKVFKLDDNGVQKSFRIKLDYFKLSADKQELTGTLQWNENNDVVIFNSFEVLPPKKSVSAVVQVSFEELKGGSWVRVIENGQPITEKSEITFTTGTAPDYIPLSNVQYSYPVIGQLNYYKDESTEGYIRLERGQGYLFEPNDDFQQVGRFTDSRGGKAEYNFSYNSGTISFTIPSDKLNLNQIYAFELVNVPKKQAGSVDRNVTEVTTSIGGNTDMDTEIKTKQAEGSIEELQEKSIFTSYFRSSKYSTLSQKVSAINFANTLRGLRVLWTAHYLKTPFVNDEPFDKAELEGSRYTQNKPLIRLAGSLSDNFYFTNKIFPLVYDAYPIDGDLTISYRNTAELGVPPVRAAMIVQQLSNFELNQNDLSFTNYAGDQYILYDLPYYYYHDFIEIQQKVVHRYLSKNVSSSRTETIIWGQFPSMTKGQYKIGVSFYPPTKETPTSTKEIVLENPVD